ncbi:MAG: 50S ribosome-binding GTPase [Planctomycetaceae bacterium]
MNFPASSPSNPRAAVITARGRGAVATIRVAGVPNSFYNQLQSLFQPANQKSLSEQPTGRILYGLWGQNVPEDVVVSRISEGELEIHCHGGEAAVQRILADLKSIGITVLSWQKMLAASAGGLATECMEALSHARTPRTAEWLLEQQSGILQEAIESLLHSLLSHFNNKPSEQPRRAWLAALDEMLTFSQFGRHLSEPWKVILVGQPNVGKSSLVNALVGYARSIVFDQPGTTRDVVTVETVFDGWPVQLSDTAGLREDADELESVGIERARERLLQADCRVLLFDISQPHNDADTQLLNDWPDAILVAHKCDLPSQRERDLPERAIAVSSTTGEGVEPLAREIIRRLVPDIPTWGTPFPICERQANLLERVRTALQNGDDLIAVTLLRECLTG